MTSQRADCYKRVFANLNVTPSSNTFIWLSASLRTLVIWMAVNSPRCADSWQKIKLHLSPRWLAATAAVALPHRLKKKASPVSGFLSHYRNACSVKLKSMHFRLCNTFLCLMRLEWVQSSVMKTRLATFTLFPTEELPAACYWGSSHGTPGTAPLLFSPLDYSAPACRTSCDWMWFISDKQGLKSSRNQTLGFSRICSFVG